MAFNVSDFRGQLEFGGARPSLFEVQIFNPVNAAGDLKVPFMCRAAQIPGATVGTIPVSYFGRQVKLAGNRTFDAWTPTIINDEDFLIRNAIEEWNNQINTFEGNLRTTGDTPASYKSTAIVKQFAKDGTVLRTYEFDGIPEPSSIALITVAGLVATHLRRRKNLLSANSFTQWSDRTS